MAEVEDDAPGVPEWVVTYGDMMSLLLTFFIMLVSMSELKDEGRIRAMLDSIRESFGATLGSSGVPGPSQQQNSILNKRNSSGIRSEGGVNRSSRNAQGLAGAFQPVTRINHGTVITLGGPAMFEQYSAERTVDLESSLDRLVRVLSSQTQRFVVRGHASPEPLPDGHPLGDHWNLSFARAVTVANYLMEKGIKADRIRLAAAGSNEPRVLTREPEQQALNRRVDVFLIDSYSSHSPTTP